MWDFKSRLTNPGPATWLPWRNCSSLPWTCFLIYDGASVGIYRAAVGIGEVYVWRLRVTPQHVVILQMPSTPSPLTELRPSDSQPPSLGRDGEATWACVGQGLELPAGYAHQEATADLGWGSSGHSTLSSLPGLGTRPLEKLPDEILKFSIKIAVGNFD